VGKQSYGRIGGRPDAAFYYGTIFASDAWDGPAAGRPGLASQVEGDLEHYVQALGDTFRWTGGWLRFGKVAIFPYGLARLDAKGRWRPGYSEEKGYFKRFFAIYTTKIPGKMRHNSPMGCAFADTPEEASKLAREALDAELAARAGSAERIKKALRALTRKSK
jgi:hypothetical protein